MTILLPLEIKHREFHSKIFLASKILEKTNFQIVIGEKSKVYNIFKKNEEVYLLSKGGPKPGFRFEKRNYKKNYLGILDEEGPILNLDVNEKKTRLHKHILNNIDDYFLWGIQDLKKNKFLFRKYNKKLQLFGHPKFDILKNKSIKFYENDIHKIKKKFKNFILVSSSFPVDQVMPTKSFNKFRFQNFEMGKNRDKIISKFNKYLNFEKENYLKLIDLLINFAKLNPDINIIFRPHPRQNINLVKKRFKPINKNIKIIYEGVITPWIAASDLYIHSGCTSVLEAAALKKKVIYFIYKEHYKKSKMFRKYGYYFNNTDKCLSFMNSNIKKNKMNLISSKQPINIIENTKINKFFYKNFIKFMINNYNNKLSPIKNLYSENNSLKEKTSKIKSNAKKIIMKIPFLKDLVFYIKPSTILSKDYKKKKFPYLNKNEIVKCISWSTNKKILVKQLSKDLFLLKK